MNIDNIKRFRVIIIGFFLMSFVGCEDTFDEALSRADDSRETLEGVLSDPDKIYGMLNGCYMGIPLDRSDIYFWTTFESLTDNAFDIQGPSAAEWRSGLLATDYMPIVASRDPWNAYASHFPGGNGYWGRYWGAIRHCNTLISNIDNISVSLEQLPQEERELMLDEAIVLRAYYHHLLISMYGPLPFMDENMPVDFKGWGELERPTYDEISSRIAEELQKVIDKGNIPLKRDPNNVNDKYRVPLGFAYGLKSRVLLYNASPLNNPNRDVEKYEKAVAAAEQFLGLNEYSLEPFEETKKMYTSSIGENLEAREVIWRGRDRFNQLNYVHGMNLAEAEPAKSKYSNFKAGETPTQEIVDCYELKNGAMIIENYDETHANPTFTEDALAAGYDDVNNPYVNRDDRFYRDILFNGNYFGESYQMGPITVWTYEGAPGTGTNGISVSGDSKRTYTGYYYGKDRDPLFYGTGNVGMGTARCHAHSILMRYAEIYLNYAEALCGAGRFEEACDALNMTRLRANQPSIRDVPDYQAGDTDWLMERIRNERRVELVLEDHRFYDVRRWDLINHQNHNMISGMLIEKNENGGFTHKRYQTPFTWKCHNERYKVLPIPQVDKNLLHNMEQPEAWQ